MISACKKCGGFIYRDWEERACLNCGYKPDVLVYVGTMPDMRRGKNGRRQYNLGRRRVRATI